MKTRYVLITIMIGILLGLLPLSIYAAEVLDGPSKKTPEPKEEIIESLKAMDEAEEGAAEDTSQDKAPAQKESKDNEQIKEEPAKPQEGTDSKKAVDKEKSQDKMPVKTESKNKAPAKKVTVKPKEQTDKNNIYFSKGSHALNANDKNILNNTAAWLKENKTATLVIEGYANDYKSSEQNLMLGELRVGSVLSYLIEQGISIKRLTAVSYGSQQPSSSAKMKDPKNWRVCFLIKKMETQ